MTDVLSALAVLSQLLRTVLLAGGIVLAGVATADWAVRTRRINPFSGIARFMRGRVEPRLAGVERQITRVGGHPASTPWWALLVYVVFAALLLASIDLIASLVHDVLLATSLGAAGVLALVLRWTFAILRLALILRVIASWFPPLATRRWMSWSFGATDWMLRPLRRVIPTLGVMDITPIVAYFALQIAEWLILRVLFGGMP